MGQINVTVNGRTYSVGCDDGEEEHIAYLADFVDNRVKELAASVGQVGEARLMLMAALVIADDLAEAVDELESARAEIAATDGKQPKPAENGAALEKLARRLEDIAARLENA